MDYTQANRQLWNEWTKLHVTSEYYDAHGFRVGKSTLGEIELDEVGQVEGKSLLHLQCHLGLEALSWARKGAQVTAVDFSEEAIDFARALGQEQNIPAEFICSDVYELPKVLHRQFDIVFSSHGAICWLADLFRWAKIAASYLKPGGRFYLLDGHPVKRLLCPRVTDDAGNPLDYGYFPRRQPVRVLEQGSYAVESTSWHTAYYWSHSLGEIVTAVAAAGLKLEFLHEFPSEEHPNFPVVFSIRARR